MAVQIHQRTTLFHDFFIRVVGVIGGVWVCARWAFKVGSKTAEVVTGKRGIDGEILVQDAKSTSRRGRWTGGSLTKRPQRMGGWDGADALGSAPMASPGWSPSVGLNAPYSPSIHGVAPISPTPSGGLSPPSPFMGHARMPSGGSGWNVPSPLPVASTASGFPTSPLPLPTPYSPAAGFAAAQSSQPSSLVPSVPGSPAPPMSPYGPNLGGANRPSLASSYGPRPSSGLNPNRTSPSPAPSEAGMRAASGGSLSNVSIGRES